MKEVVFATANSHKLAEARQIIKSVNSDIEVLPFDGPSPEETGTSFLENARIKALAAFQATGKLSLADDSGLCVDVMGGAPGIFSAIWSGTRSDEQNRRLLLSQLAEISSEYRQASFVCTVALVGEGIDVSFTGVWPGSIGFEALGSAGFGYDPIFLPEGFTLTAAELDSDLKNSISHRFLAMAQMAAFLTN